MTDQLPPMTSPTLVIEFPDMELDTAMGSLFDINVAMEKEGFAPASKGF
jgi:hypothetical protein